METKILLTVATITAIFLLEGAFPHFPGRTRRLAHAFPHVITALLNAILTGMFFAEMTEWAANFSGARAVGLLHVISLPEPVSSIAAFILFDIWMYFWHMANHRVSFLWLFHRAHHADVDMDTTTALRFHPGELLLSSLARMPVITLTGMDLGHIVIFETALNVSTLFHHGNLRIPEPWDRAIRFVIVSPNMHRVHHSIKRAELNSNFTSLFSIWDRLFGTFRLRDDTRAITLGLTSLRDSKWQRLWGFFITPFLK